LIYPNSAVRSSPCAVPLSLNWQRDSRIAWHQKHSLKSLLQSPPMGRRNSWTGSLWPEIARRELSRLSSADRDRALRKALARREETIGAANRDPTLVPCPWFSTAADLAKHAAWVRQEPPEAVAYEQLDWRRRWQAGQPVRLETAEHRHTAWVRLEHLCFERRWCRPGRRFNGHSVVCVSELTFSDPRSTWINSYELAVATAMVSSTDPRCAWLAGPFDPATEPELADLYDLALAELRPLPAPADTPGPFPTPAPAPRRGWTRPELEALRIPAGVIEHVAATATRDAGTLNRSTS